MRITLSDKDLRFVRSGLRILLESNEVGPDYRDSGTGSAYFKECRRCDKRVVELKDLLSRLRSK